MAAAKKRSKLKALYTQIPPGTPFTADDLDILGISTDLAAYYMRTGWLTGLARGVYCRPNDPLALHPCLMFLQRRFKGIHVGGRSALEWHGIQHFVRFRPVLHLYGWTSGHLPEWFTTRFPAKYYCKRLFDEQSAMLHVGQFPFGRDADLSSQVSSRERALLEFLSQIPVRHRSEEARLIVEMTYTFRSRVLRELLQRCTSLKTVRLCLRLGREESLPWIGKLDMG